MQATATKTELNEIAPLRILFLQEFNRQFIHNAFHERGWAGVYLLAIDGVTAGYGSIQGRGPLWRDTKGWDTIFEFYVIPPFRKYSSQLFRELIDASGAKYIECQSNDLQLFAMLWEFSISVNSETVLFEDHVVTNHVIPGAVVRHGGQENWTYKTSEAVGEYVLELGGEVVASAGYLLHYNKPFADLWMEVREDHRRRGLGSFALQEVKKECYLAGRVPAARCNMKNPGSRASLIRAGMRVCGFWLIGQLDHAG
jgi:GNAT superfamily N-acetyltransferase